MKPFRIEPGADVPTRDAPRAYTRARRDHSPERAIARPLRGTIRSVHDDLSGIRIDYAGAGFSAADAGSDPMARFDAWFEEASELATVVEPNAMALATSAPDGTPSVRMVLLKAVDAAAASFGWHTNLESRKATECLRTGTAALCWWWPGAPGSDNPGRQVRAVGRVERLDRDASRAYFERRPIEARVSAVASHQSRAVQDRATIDARAAAIDPSSVELPASWGGLRLVADELEFWQGRTARLHDRITFLRLDEHDAVLSRPAADAAGGDDALLTAGTIVTDPHGTRWLRARLEP
ncbi:MAG: putative pyridoxine 5-phosphate oxidase [Thermoleophilia bacterium]|nr:putative pyridoxine 5-phosphate oxidase [Thermoleophilia bacterium]